MNPLFAAVVLVSVAIVATLVLTRLLRWAHFIVRPWAYKRLTGEDLAS